MHSSTVAFEKCVHLLIYCLIIPGRITPKLQAGMLTKKEQESGAGTKRRWGMCIENNHRLLKNIQEGALMKV